MHNNTFLFTKIVLSYLFLIGCSAQQLPDTSGKDISIVWSVLENYHQEKNQNLARFVIKNDGPQHMPGEDWKLYFNSFRPVVSSDTSLVRFRHISGDLSSMSPAGSFPSLSPGDSVIIDYVSQYTALNISDAPAGLYFTFAGGGIEKPGSYAILPFPEEKYLTRGVNDKLPVATPDRMFHRNKNLSVLGRESLVPIIPSPVSFRSGSDTVYVTNSTHKLRFDSSLKSEAKYLIDAFASFGLTLNEAGENYDGHIIELTQQLQSGSAESYTLEIHNNGHIQINGTDAAGVFYGIQSLISLVPLNEVEKKIKSVSLPVVKIQDSPRFNHRGMFLDVSRNFQKIETVLKLLDLMSRYKLNRFHMHLADDEGWRIEIPGLPELTEVGSRRGHTLNENDMLHPSYGSGPFVDSSDNYGTGYYSTEEFIEILTYASERHIEVIPEIDVPGHARAAIKSMLARYRKLINRDGDDAARQYLLTDLEDRSVYTSIQNYDDNVINPCLTSTYTFMEKVIDGIRHIYDMAEVPLTTFHIGGDEVPDGVWTKAPSCRDRFPGRNADEMKLAGYTFFVDSLSSIIESKGLSIGGWEDVGVGGQHGNLMPNRSLADREIVLNAWNSIWGGNSEDLAFRLANSGYDIVLSNATNLYFDMAVYKHPQEPGLYWAAFIDTKNAFEFTPMDVFKSAYVSLMGDTLRDSQWENKVQLTSAGRQNIRGIQAQLWSETVRGPDRMEYMIFPRILALAQRAWSPQPGFATIENRKEREDARDEAWNTFANVMGQYALPQLDRYPGGVNYNIPAPGAIVTEGRLQANLSYPGLTIRYTTDGSEPNQTSPAYAGPVDVEGIVHLKTFTENGRSSRTVHVNP